MFKGTYFTHHPYEILLGYFSTNVVKHFAILRRKEDRERIAKFSKFFVCLLVFDQIHLAYSD